MFSHNPNTLCKKCYYAAASLDPQLGSSSGNDTKYEYVQKIIIVKMERSGLLSFYLKNTLKYMKSVEG